MGGMQQAGIMQQQVMQQSGMQPGGMQQLSMQQGGMQQGGAIQFLSQPSIRLTDRGVIFQIIVHSSPAPNVTWFKGDGMVSKMSTVKIYSVLPIDRISNSKLLMEIMF